MSSDSEAAAHRQQDLYFTELFQLAVQCRYMRRYRNVLARRVRQLEILRAVASSGAIATWAVVRSYPMVWATIIAACGTRLYHVPGGASYPNRNLKLGTLDDATWLKPTVHFWTRSAQKWVMIPEDAVRYETQPETLSWVPPTP